MGAQGFISRLMFRKTPTEVIVVFAAALSLVLGSAAFATERLAILPNEDRDAWRAVGLVTSQGPKGRVTCSGTLVAPDLVITAAHCVAHEAGLMRGIQFIAGLDGTRRTASSGAMEVLRYPVWDYATGQTRVRWDLAALRLGRLIPRDRLKPVELYPDDQSLPVSGALLGYQGRTANRLHGRFGCPLDQTGIPGVIMSDCRVTRGNSGGPVMVRKDNDWLLAGIIVASDETGETSIMVETNAWLMEQVRAAEDREALRAGRAD